MDRSLATYDKPLLNCGIPYESEAGRTYEDDHDIIFPCASKLRVRTHISQQEFEKIYTDIMRFFTETERYQFKSYQEGTKPVSEFYRDCANRLQSQYESMRNENDFKAMMNRIMIAMFGYDVLQPLIDEPETTDIKVCGPNDIRVRVEGKAYRSDASFIDGRDLYRFVEGLSIRNHVDILRTPIITFTDMHDANYILRFTVTTTMVTPGEYPMLHIRKVSKTKPDFDELIRRKMLNEDVKRYLIDRAKLSRGIVFAGPPGSGKSTALNAWIEHIPRTRETLVIQENDELFTNQSGFMFKHVTHGFSGEPVVTLEELGRMALVEGCNQFIIGEVKGGEMRSAMTLVNAGGYAALTVHTTNAYETLDKLADLVKYGSSYSFEEARRMLKTFDTIVYMEGYKVREILECTGYDDIAHKYQYINIYRYEGENDAQSK